MKLYLIICFLALFLQPIQATDPIKKKRIYVEFDLSYQYYIHYNQIAFQKKGIGLGGGAIIGHSAIPVFLEYFYQSPLTFAYRNNELKESYQELGLRISLNNLSYLIPYGVDPYIGAGLVHKISEFKQYSIDLENPNDLLSSASQTSMNYKLTGGIKFGSRNVIIGLQYDYLPSRFTIPDPENQGLSIYNSQHIFTMRAGIRLSPTFQRNKVRCPSLNKKQKRTLAF
ncbi:outer membrane protein [Portibacter lacus]|uniref:Outer membrane protein beta-barrel domain-containing protein n=1 Tax=Portibacter lacus TaxID=1099794 RepID=A0AA37SQ63_9BACT|nr:hypothetical protein [Portibacter lacus]GLR17229.1 hypothetical protein GCM10007940_18440 [Portibacter lacus]